MRYTKLIAFIFILLLNCEKKYSISPEDNTYSIKGNINEASDTLLIPIENAFIEIDSKKDTSDSFGKYYLGNISKGQYQIIIAHDHYYTIDTSANIFSDTVCNYIMTPIFGDYFPLHMGNKITYKAFESYRILGQSEYLKEGFKDWVIIGSEEDNGSMRYSAAEIFTGISITNYFQDTTIIQNDTTYFSIIEDTSHYITINLDPFMDIPEFPKYSPIKIGDTLIVKYDREVYWGTQYIYFIKDTGLHYTHINKGTAHNGKSWQYEIVK